VDYGHGSGVLRRLWCARVFLVTAHGKAHRKLFARARDVNAFEGNAFWFFFVKEA
jgi:hypothetical protein